MLDLLDPHLPGSTTVLDLGAGEGYLARRLYDRIQNRGLSTRVIACDLFPENFCVPEVLCHGINLHGELPMADASLDLAYSVEVIEHLEDQFSFLREAHRVLRPGGRFVLTTPNVLNLTSRLRTLLVGFPELFGPLPLRTDDPQHVGGHIHPVSVYYLAYMARKAGFDVASCRIDRVKSSSVAALLLWPLLSIASSWARAGMNRRDRHAVEDNKVELRLVNSLKVLTGRTIILELVKRGDGDIPGT